MIKKASKEIYQKQQDRQNLDKIFFMCAHKTHKEIEP